MKKHFITNKINLKILINIFNNLMTYYFRKYTFLEIYLINDIASKIAISMPIIIGSR